MTQRGLNADMRPCSVCYLTGIITNGGVQPNLVPDYSELKFWLRAPSHMDLVHMQQKCQACIVAAAKVRPRPDLHCVPWLRPRSHRTHRYSAFPSVRI